MWFLGREVGFVMLGTSMILFFYAALSTLLARSKYAVSQLDEEDKLTGVGTPNYLDPSDSVAFAVEHYPMVEDFLYHLGARAIKNPIVKKTFAKRITLASLAKSLNLDVEEFMRKLNNYIHMRIVKEEKGKD